MNDKEPTEGQRENAINKAKLLRAYAKVFGTDGNRSIDQQSVWDDMTERAGIWKHDVIISNTGHIDPIRMNILGGQRLFFINICNLIREGRLVQADKTKAKAKVIKE